MAEPVKEITIQVKMDTAELDAAKERLKEFSCLLDQVQAKADSMGIRMEANTVKS